MRSEGERPPKVGVMDGVSEASTVPLTRISGFGEGLAGTCSPGGDRRRAESL